MLRFPFSLWTLILVLMSGALLGQSKEAIRFYKKGQASYQKRLLIQASVDYTEAISIEIDYIQAIQARADVFRELNETKSAIKDYERVLSIDASLLMPKIQLLDLYAKAELYSDGIRIATLMIVENPDNIGAALLKRGDFYHKKGDAKRAKADYKSFLKIDDDFYNEYKVEIRKKLSKM